MYLDDVDFRQTTAINITGITIYSGQKTVVESEQASFAYWKTNFHFHQSTIEVRPTGWVWYRSWQVYGNAVGLTTGGVSGGGLRGALPYALGLTLFKLHEI